MAPGKIAKSLSRRGVAVRSTAEDSQVKVARQPPVEWDILAPFGVSQTSAA
jgi:hypothetical protein